MPVLESLRYARGSLQVLDQLKVPHQKEYVDVPDADAAWAVVRSMQVRGAPLIAIVSALGLAVEAEQRRQAASEQTAGEGAAWLRERMTHLRTSRPTAVNLFNAMECLGAVVTEEEAKEGSSAGQVYEAYVAAAERMLSEDVAANKAIGDHGAEAILAAMEKAGRAGEGARVLTICNTGSLATAGWGTALGVIRSLHARGRLERAYALETRPYNQGARLTAFELVEDSLPGTLVCDSMAAALMLRRGVDACVVGADRVAANGDTANKIGTYGLSVLAKHHAVPFFVAVPTTSLAPKTKTGAEIPIEERPGDELCCLTFNGETYRLPPQGIDVWNPAFDVTPADLIDGLVTERGLIPRANDKVFDVCGFLGSLHG
uniref:Methylthioribose-1-phosphate isomerase n=1 Tax=Pyrodinium bahamense TaxID=73915 RepID=A0A7S0B777_9DINO|mmetsp:Transcript_52826/g.146411  ORF Transcript_52826/g.146411 Transcript_52826/m.146411 type:complete len:374 (+) Transcript_52826:107-1228(+)